ncbi:DUF1205 domain-containing protein [Saccharopolyspora sp. K220]|uniref:nucleotide disphospho-sugar-binding domain-containing protein n=1 Tax=Saccharopolyspora soli TaxID=2926618 RepID=UPI001F5A730A|nr:nucleotide disphospho-sugar-binding domain-containing protein [Saccharopolyspora soli]MCI2423216.1 DUF1205 domain-containing protein [Saccharopolyspora soli]
MPIRVLFVSTPGIGHVFPMVPLAWALRAAGHEVRFATAGAALAVARAGLPVVDVAPDFDFAAAQARIARENPELVQRMRAGQVHDLRDLAAMFGHISNLLADGVAAAALRWRPDVIVQSPVQGAGLLAAAVLEIPFVEHGFGFARTTGIATLASQHMPEVFDRHGVTELPRQHAIDVAPPSMLDAEPDGWSMRYVPFNGGATLPEWLEIPPQRPRFAVTLGTTAPIREGLDPLRRIVEAARRAEAEFVLAVEESDARQLGPLPSNVRAAGWVPLNALLPTCQAIVHHGGAGTTLTALAHGVPQLVVPTGSDRFINAEAVRLRNVGLAASPEEVTADLLASTAQDDAISTAAQEVRHEIDTMPTPAQIAARLVELRQFAEAP